MALLSPYRKRADIAAASSTTVQFAASARLTTDPIKLGALSGRIASLTAVPTALTISGTSGTRYVYASLAAPSGTAYSGLLTLLGGGILQNLTNLIAALQTLFTGDGTTGVAAQLSTVTFVETASATPPDTHHVPLGQFECSGGVITSLTSYESQVEVTVSAFIHGQCRLAKVGSDLKLTPLNGQSLVIDGTARSVPVAGVTLAPSGLTPDTLYYIYAAWSGSAITLEASTTTHAQHTNGVEIKSGDSTRTLVGVVWVITGPAFADTAVLRLVRSWFNDPPTPMTAAITADRSSSSGSYGKLHAEVDLFCVTWAGEGIAAAVTGRVSASTSALFYTGIGVDSTTTPEDGISVGRGESGINFSIAAYATKAGLTEGLHTLSVLVKVSDDSTTWEGTTTPERVAHNAHILKAMG